LSCKVSSRADSGYLLRRFRLWHVDLLINRSLVYGVVTVLLVLIFLGGGFLLQGVVGRENASLAFAISIAAAPTDPSEVVPGLPSSVADSVMRALEKDPRDRFQSARAFAVALS
jgi:hypothetical protein